MTEYRLGERHERPPDAPASWSAGALEEVRRTAVGDVPIRLDLDDAAPVPGLSEGVGVEQTGHQPVIELDTGLGDRLEYVEFRRIEAFTLLRDASLDRSDELGGRLNSYCDSVPYQSWAITPCSGCRAQHRQSKPADATGRGPVRNHREVERE